MGGRDWRKGPGRVPVGETGEGHDDPQLTRMGSEPDIAFVLPPADASGKRATQAARQLGDGRRREPHVTEHGPRKIGNHRIERRFVGQLQCKEEVVNRHGAKSYSERRLNSKRARVTSAPIWAFKASTDSNARSSRNRCTNPTRIDSP
jgi:hypothetical protein